MRLGFELGIIHVGMVLDTVVNHGKSAKNSNGTQNPSRDEYIHVRYQYGVRMPYTSSTSRLQPFVGPGEHSKLGQIVRHGSQ